MAEEAKPRRRARWWPLASPIFDAVGVILLTPWVIIHLADGELVWDGVLVGALIGVGFAWSQVTSSDGELATLLGFIGFIALTISLAAAFTNDSWLSRVFPYADATFVESARGSLIAAIMLTRTITIAIGWIRRTPGFGSRSQ